ncbi:UNVERIFIED_CONTAM: hypothetical protein ABID98_002378 [Brevibacillus sp. OAP136]
MQYDFTPYSGHWKNTLVFVLMKTLGVAFCYREKYKNFKLTGLVYLFVSSKLTQTSIPRCTEMLFSSISTTRLAYLFVSPDKKVT